jgi:hypothetical protein
MARLTGKNGAVYLDVVGTMTKIADIFDWEFHQNTTVYDVSIKGDPIERFVPSHSSGVRFTAKRYNQGLQAFAGIPTDAALNATLETWRLDLVDASGSFTQITVYGYAIAASTNAPRGMSEETIEIQCDYGFSYSK